MVEIRRGDPGDAPGMAEVAEDAWWAAYAGFLDADAIRRAVSEWYDPDRLAAACDREEAPLWVAVDDGVVGFAAAERTWADTVELHALYVDPDRWGEGVGSALLEAVVEWARDVGADYLLCSVFADNPTGLAFFESEGFERLGTVETEVFGSRHLEYELEREV